MSDSLTQLYLSNPALATAIRRRQSGEQMQQAGMSTAPTDALGALARIAQAYVGHRNIGRSDEAIKGIGDEQQQELQRFMGGGTPAGTAPSPVPLPAAPSAGLSVPPSPSNASFADPAARSAAVIPPELAAHYQAASAATGIPVEILGARDKQESGFNNALRGKAGEHGISQILPSTAAAPGFGLSPTTPEELGDAGKNIMFGAKYLQARGKAAGVTDWTDPSQLAKALQAYNGGGDPNYVANVSRYLPPSYGQVASASPQAPGAVPAGHAGAPPAMAPQPQRMAAAAPTEGGAPPDTGSGGARAPGPPRASPLANVYLQQAIGLQQRAQQAAMSNNPQIRRMAPVLLDQAKLYQGLANEKPKTNVLRPGGMLVDDQGNTITSAPMEPRAQPPLVSVVGPNGKPIMVTREEAIGKESAPAPLVNIDNKAASAEVQERGTSLAKQAAAIRDEASTAAGTIDQVRQLRNIGAETDRLAPAKELFGSALDALGVKGTGPVKAATTLQAFNGALSGLVLGAQLAQKGVQTEGDAQRMREQYAKPTNTMESNNFLMRATEAQATRKMEQHDFYENWFREHKTYDGASQGWNQFIREVPMTVKTPVGVSFFNEFAEFARSRGDSPEKIRADWQAQVNAK